MVVVKSAYECCFTSGKFVICVIGGENGAGVKKFLIPVSLETPGNRGMVVKGIALFVVILESTRKSGVMA